MPVLLSCGMLRKINLPLSLSFRGKLIKIMAVPESGEVIPHIGKDTQGILPPSGQSLKTST